ncbi:MAG: hypothetical protein K9W43_08950 [Candidatus Thorarchaeota archaeon]|nr:hypothetical protein [Candidatus Thorarchaeota archaeon]
MMHVGDHRVTTRIALYFLVTMALFSLSLALTDSTIIETAQNYQSSDLFLSSAAPLVPFARKSIVLSDSSGPVFHEVPAPDEQNGVISDLVIYGPTIITLNLTVRVTDQDGVSVVIGSFKNASLGTWKNVTLSTTGSNDYYSAVATSFILDADHRGAQWDVRYFACDSTGNWTKTGIITYFYHAFLFTNSSSPEDSNELMGFSVASLLVVGATIVAIVLIVLARRR